MENNQFLTYQKFIDKFEAQSLSDLLTKNNIEFLFEDTSTGFDQTFSNNELSKEYRIKLKKQDFKKVEKILIDISEQEIDNIDTDYYLFKFTDEKLIEVLVKSDEWGNLNYLLAQKILKERGKEISKELLESFKKQRIEELVKPEKSQTSWIIIGYFFSILGGVLGVFIGWHLFSHKKTLPNGDSIYGYSIKDRKHGSRIFILGIIFILIQISLKILYIDF